MNCFNSNYKHIKNFDELNLYLVDKISTARPQDKDFHTFLSSLFILMKTIFRSFNSGY